LKRLLFAGKPGIDADADGAENDDDPGFTIHEEF
jgi:hypothetical protein